MLCFSGPFLCRHRTLTALELRLVEKPGAAALAEDIRTGIILA
jgi:hypothetical protein